MLPWFPFRVVMCCSVGPFLLQCLCLGLSMGHPACPMGGLTALLEMSPIFLSQSSPLLSAPEFAPVGTAGIKRGARLVSLQKGLGCEGPPPVGLPLEVGLVGGEHQAEVGGGMERSARVVGCGPW